MGDVSIEVDRVGKLYRLGEQASYKTLREALASASRRRGKRENSDHIWALREVDLTVHEGEALGLVGMNGSGKTTLLRILARITAPTVGVSRTRGRIGALLEIGTGFHSELSGRDNIFLGGAVMGMSRRDVRRRYAEIVDFSGVEAFMSTPLKRYSSGMRLRLAFAVAAHLEPELLFVDEILAVGDFDFQRRCIERMAALHQEGRTVVFVSHDLGAITRLCSRALWLDAGHVRHQGEPADVVSTYIGSLLTSSGRIELPVAGPVGVSSVALLDAGGQVVSQPQRGDDLIIEVRLKLLERVPGLDLGVILMTSDGARLLDEAWSDRPDMAALAPSPGEWTVRLEIPPILRAADYAITVWLGTENHTFLFREMLAFQLAPRSSDRLEWQTRVRLVQPSVRWSSRRLADTS